MPISLADRKRDIPAAAGASHIVVGVGAASDCSERHFLAVLNPAIGAQEISPDVDRKIRKAIAREVRCIKRTLILSKLRLKLDFLLLKARLLLLRARCRLGSKATNLLFGRHNPFRSW